MRTEMLVTVWWFPTNDQSSYAPLWWNWFATRGQGEYAEEPPEDVRRQMELYWDILVEPDPEEQDRMFREILEIAKEQFYGIGIALPNEGYGIVKNDLRNVPESYLETWQYHTPGPSNPPTWFFDRD